MGHQRPNSAALGRLQRRGQPQPEAVHVDRSEQRRVGVADTVRVEQISCQYRDHRLARSSAGRRIQEELAEDRIFPAVDVAFEHRVSGQHLRRVVVEALRFDGPPVRKQRADDLGHHLALGGRDQDSGGKHRVDEHRRIADQHPARSAEARRPPVVATDPGTTVAQRFTGIPLERGILRLVASETNFSLVIEYEPAASDSGAAVPYTITFSAGAGAPAGNGEVEAAIYKPVNNNKLLKFLDLNTDTDIPFSIYHRSLKPFGAYGQ